MLELYRKCISGAETGISRVNYVNNMANDVLAQKWAMPSTAMALTYEVKRVHVFLEEVLNV